MLSPYQEDEQRRSRRDRRSAGRRAVLWGVLILAVVAFWLLVLAPYAF